MIEKQKIKEATTKNNPKPEPEIPTLNFQALFNFQPKKDTVFCNIGSGTVKKEDGVWRLLLEKYLKTKSSTFLDGLQPFGCQTPPTFTTVRILKASVVRCCWKAPLSQQNLSET